jgi:hypothetical protein
MRLTAETGGEGSYTNWLIGFLALLSILIVFNSACRFFDHDEFEHLHTAWYLQQGDLPYRDVYQNHHPLFWPLLLPLLEVFGHSVAAVMSGRVLMLMMMIAMAFTVFKITALITKSREIQLYALLFLLSTVVWVGKGLEIRPDVPQALLALVSVYYLLLFFKGGRLRNMAYAGLWAALSFLFLQKTVLLLAACGPIFLYKLVKKEISLKAPLLFVLCFLAPLLPFLAYLLLTGSWPDYVLTNWIVNARQVAPFSPLRTFKNVFVENPLTWLFFLFCLWLFLVRKKGGPEMRILTIMALFLVLACFGIRHPHQQYLMLPVALFSPAAAYGLKMMFTRFRCRKTVRIRVWALLLLLPCLLLFFRIFETNRRQLQRIDYVIENSTASDLVYDGDIRFNLFRRDLHYFWYSVKPNKGLETYNRVTGGKYGDYDICRLIRQKRPRFISNYALDISACGLAEMYRKTRHKSLYVKIEQ